MIRDFERAVVKAYSALEPPDLSVYVLDEKLLILESSQPWSLSLLIEPPLRVVPSVEFPLLTCIEGNVICACMIEEIVRQSTNADLDQIYLMGFDVWAGGGTEMDYLTVC